MRSKLIQKRGPQGPMANGQWFQWPMVPTKLFFSISPSRPGQKYEAHLKSLDWKCLIEARQGKSFQGMFLSTLSTWFPVCNYHCGKWPFVRIVENKEKFSSFLQQAARNIKSSKHKMQNKGKNIPYPINLFRFGKISLDSVLVQIWREIIRFGPF